MSGRTKARHTSCGTFGMAWTVTLLIGAALLMVAVAWLAATIVMGTMMGTMMGGMMGGDMWAGLLTYPIALAIVGAVLLALGLWRRSAHSG